MKTKFSFEAVSCLLARVGLQLLSRAARLPGES